MRRLFCVLLLAGCLRGKPELPILNYHSVGDTADEYTVPVAAFEEQLDWLASHGFHTVSLKDLADSRQRRAPLPERPIILTFDDGKADALGIVLPALRKRGMRASFFVITDLVGRAGYLTWDGVRALAEAGMEIGSHTATHPRLPDLPDASVEHELVQSRLTLQAELHRPVEALAYPYNSVRARIEQAARAAGYRVAVAGVDHGSADLLSLRRMPVDGLTRIERLSAELAVSKP
jgi:peptidoglycan/xylan/chitin deacetylase (PgdA/CDA1 family)